MANEIEHLQAHIRELAGSLGHKMAEIERLRAALQLIDDYYQTGGELMSHVSHVAQDALAGVNEQPAIYKCPDCGVAGDHAVDCSWWNTKQAAEQTAPKPPELCQACAGSGTSPLFVVCPNCSGTGRAQSSH